MKLHNPLDISLYQTLIERLPTAVLILNSEKNYIYSNDALFRLSGLNPAHLAGNRWINFIHPEDRKTVDSLLAQVDEPEAFSATKKVRITADKEITFLVAATEVRAEAGQCLYVLSFTLYCHGDLETPKTYRQGDAILNLGTSDVPRVSLKSITSNLISNQIQQERLKLEERIVSLKDANDLKDKILAIISHDLRSPISSLKGLSSAFFDDAITPDERNTIRESLLNQLDSVGDLTENLLRWASLSFLNKDHAERQLLPLSELIEQNVLLTRYQAELKNLKVSTNVSDALAVFANKDNIMIVLRNILTNAIKYTPEDGNIHISAVSSGRFVQIRIADTGVGLSTEQLERLFGNMHSNTYGTNGEKGIGLGLIVCKEYIEANEGKLLVTSKLHLGTTVLIELPSENRNDLRTINGSISVAERS